ncbi:MAG: plasmid stabilization protein [Gammaproteobacteria bacterium]|nr:plasmid stabilization protein [Gammaproteobacteria bacterium]MYH84665.1 plasmid stabilization protein [Gammaproteobacteria bacterium]MYK04235.1 plasmid stabilization protein [Gammaproteobacteria bacterium]
MASITFRNLDEGVNTRLRVGAARLHRSMGEERRLVLRDAIGRPESPRILVSTIRIRISPLGDTDLELPPREFEREPPSFD